MNKYKQVFVILAVTIFVVPQIALADWWNPFSWSVWNIFKPTPKVELIQITDNTQATSTASTTKKIENNIKQEKPKESNIPKKDLALPTPVKKTEVIKNDVEVVTNPRTALINEFLKNPTLENFKTFCNSAKNIEGKKTKQVLDSNRVNMITVKLSLYDDFNDCLNLDNLDRGVSYLPLGNSLLVDLAGDDSNDMREAKIIFNNKVKNIIATSKFKFVAFKKYPITVQTPTELFQSYVDLYNKQVQLIRQSGHADISADMRAQDNSLKSNLMNSADSIIDVSNNFN